MGGGYASHCKARAQSGYQSGMGEIFRKVASINIIVTRNNDGSLRSAVSPTTTTTATTITTTTATGSTTSAADRTIAASSDVLTGPKSDMIVKYILVPIQTPVRYVFCYIY